MKKIFFVISCIIISISTLSAQSNTETGIIGSVQLPIVSVNNKSDYNIETSNRIGYSAGLILNLYKKNFIGLQSELVYNNKPSHVTISNKPGNLTLNQEADFNVQYLVYGLKARINYANVYIAPYFTIGMLANIYLSDNLLFNNLTAGNHAEFSDGVERITTSVTVGSGFELKLSKEINLLIELDYSQSIKDFYENTYFNVSGKFNTYELKSGLLFNL